MTDELLQTEHAGSFSGRQKLFVKYTFFILVDLTVLNLFNQFWDLVFVENFLVSLLVAVLLQVLLQITIAIEHRVANYFKNKPGIKHRIFRGLSTWGILFASKLVILEAIDFSFGSSVLFGGPIHGLVAFIIVVIAMVVAEQTFVWINRSLA